MIKKLSPNFSERNGYKPEVIVIHIMQGTLAGTGDWFSKPESQSSAHYGIGLNGEVHQYVDDEKCAWSQGKVGNPTFSLYKPNVNPNLYCLSIENEGYDLSKAPETQLLVLIELVKTLATKFNIPIDRAHIIGHREINSVTRPTCPSSNNDILDMIVRRCQLVSLPNNSKKLILEIKQKVLELEKELSK